MIPRMVGFIRSQYEVVLMFLISATCVVYIFHFSDIRQVALYWFNEVGPTFYLMLPMSVILVWFIIMFIIDRIDANMLNGLRWLESLSPQVGLLGSVVGLIDSLQGFDFSHDTTTMIQAVVSGLLKALVSTGYGLVIAIIAGNVYRWAEKRHVK